MLIKFLRFFHYKINETNLLKLSTIMVWFPLRVLWSFFFFFLINFLLYVFKTSTKLGIELILVLVVAQKEMEQLSPACSLSWQTNYLIVAAGFTCCYKNVSWGYFLILQLCPFLEWDKLREIKFEWDQQCRFICLADSYISYINSTNHHLFSPQVSFLFSAYHW